MYSKKTLILLIFVMFIVGISYVSAEDIDNANVLSADSDLNTVSVDESLSDINEKSVSDAIDDSVTDSYESNVNSDNSDSNLNENNKGTDENNGGSEEVNNEISLGSASSEILSDDLDIAIVDPSNFTTETFNTHHDVYYLPDGIYTVSSLVYIGGRNAGTAQSNFVVRGDANTILDFDNGYISIARGTNCILENLKFIHSPNSGIIDFGNYAKNVTIRNCTFEDITCKNVISAGKSIKADNIKIENCSFKNCVVGNVISFLREGVTITLSNNIFENCEGTLINVTSNIGSEVSFSVLSRDIIDTGSVIQCKLVDDNGNAIYSPKLKFVVNGEELAPIFDAVSGIYSLSYVPSGGDTVSVSASCSNAPNLAAETAYLPILPSPNPSVEAVCSEYAYQTIYMNATLNEAITNENVTFVIKNPKGVIIESVDKMITNGFAEATIILNASSAGYYSAGVVYNGSDQFAGASAFEEFYVYKGGIQANITPGDYGAFSLEYDIYYLPDGIYTINSALNVGNSEVPYSNFIIRGGDNTIISFAGDASNTGITCSQGVNVTFENLKFTAAIDLRKSDGIIRFTGKDNITIRNCSFENITKNTGSIIRSSNYNAIILNNASIKIENCSFINCTVKDGISFESEGTISLSNCIFKNCIGTPLSIFDNGLTNGGILTEADFNCISNNVSATGSYIFGELVDDNGNSIYSPKLKFLINDEEKTPSFDRSTGLYSFWYVPTESQVSVRAVCSNVQTLNVETSSLLILASPDLSLNSTQSITYGEELIIVNATLNEAITNENVTFILKDSSGNVIKSVDALITNGFANSSFVEKLLPGTYTISVIYGGDDEFSEGSASAQLIVNKLTGYINVSANNVTVFDDVIVTFTMPEEINGELEMIRIGCFYNPSGGTNGIAIRENIAVINGTASVNFGKLAANDDTRYIYYISYNFISKHPLYGNINTHSYWTSGQDRTKLAQFKVLKVDTIPIIDVNDICLGDNATISVSGLAENATGTVTYYVDDGEAVVKNIGETFTVEGLGVGEHNVRVVYSGDANYSANETSATFNVFTIALESYDLDYDENVAVVAVLPDGAEGMLVIEVDGIDPVSAQVVNGSAAFELSGLKPGNYTLHMAYQGTPVDLHADVDVTVIPKITNVDDLNTVYNAIGIDLPSDATGSLTVTVDGNTTIVVPVENGTAKCTIENLTAGEHEITVAYEGNYPSYSSTQTVSVAKVTPEGKVNAPASITAGSAVTVPIELPSDASGIVLVDVDGKKYYAEVVNGTANVDIAGLTAGDKVLTYKYLGDDKYNGFTANTTLKVTEEPVVPAKVATKITAPKVSAVYNVAKNLVITLTDKDGKALANKKVTVKVGTISKTLTTNAKGQVSLNVATLVPKTYTATVKFAGDDAYLASSVSPKVVVSKAKPKITAKAKTFKVKVKTKKYTVTLKNNKGKVLKKVKLTLKVGKKTYKATTNSKGKATFKITKLTKKGKYAATVKFAGSKYYKALSKKVKITVKK